MYAEPSERENSIDDVEWPLNEPCNGLNDNSFNISDFILSFGGLHDIEKHILAS